MNLDNCVLYYRESCPFCQRVLRYMEKTNVTCEMKSTDDEANKNELIEIGGKGQVPCMVIDGDPLYESMDIIQFISSKLQNRNF